jgi:hypothetical protein
VEAATRLDGRADDHELCPALRRHARDILAEAPRPRADDLPPHPDAVRAGHGGRGLQPIPQCGQLFVEVCVQRQLALDDERRDEDDVRAPICREPAGEVEGVLRLLPLEQRHDDAPVGDRLGLQRKPPHPAP